ncbi:unknown [Firmicutes bacterium CAG:822]|nr:unknown [Firmicutes bacterium CAG:822]
MNKSILIKIVKWICDGYVDALITGIEENENYFPYTIAVIHFIDELQRKNIKIDYKEIFNDSIIDNVLKEANDYLMR